VHPARRGGRRRLACVAALAVAITTGVAAAQSGPLPPQLHTVAGGGSCAGALTAGGPCDGVAATSVPVQKARSVSALPGGGFLYVDEADRLVREVSPAGTVTTVAGNTTENDGCDGTMATQSGLDDPVSVAALPSGGFLETEFAGSAVRLVSPAGTITTIAGSLPAGSACPGGATTGSVLNHPTDAEPTSDGGVLIADTYDNRVVRLSAASPSAAVATVAGGGSCDDTTAACDGLSAGAVGLDHPDSVSPIQGGAGGYLIAEYDADAIREISTVSPQGSFTTVAGTPGHAGYAGDGGPADQALLDHPEQVTATPDGGFLIADTGNERIRAVSATGSISTVAGSGQASYAGDGGDATAGSLMEPSGVIPAPDGGMLIADLDNGRIRAVTIPATTTITLSPAAPDGNNSWYDTPVHVTITAARSVDTRCTADPTAAPTVYDELPDSCPYLGAGADIGASGQHTVYAASADAAGDKELPISTGPIMVDATPPQVTCGAEPSFLVGTPGSVSAAVTDQVSGTPTPTVHSAADTRKLGTQTVMVSGTNNAGGTASAKCSYRVIALKFDPTPKLDWMIAPAPTTGGRPPRPVASYATVRRLRVTGVPSGATVTLECSGRGCPVHSVKCSARRCPQQKHAVVDVTPVLARGRLRPGVKLTVIISRASTIGRVWVLTIRDRGKPRYRVTCVAPGSVVVGKGC
jgi:hypothetical protein